MRYIRLTLLIPVICALGACAGEKADIQSPRQLIEAMHARYDGNWYSTLTFKQETIQYRGPDGAADTSLWYEAMSLPGKLRIDIAPIENGNGLLFADDRRYVFRGDTLLFERDEVHPLMLLGFDVYAQEPSVTLAKLDSLGVDLTVIHEGEWEGRPVYVVGAQTDDTRSRQFWIDREHLYLVRMIQPDGPGGQSLVEIRFSDYVSVGGGWVGRVVEFFVDGRIALLEVYSDVEAGRELSPELFDPSTWATAEHWIEDAAENVAP